MGVGERGAFGRDEEVAGERELESAGDARAVDRADHRLAHLPERGEGRDRRVIGATHEVGRVLPELAQIQSGAERGIGAGEDHDVDVGVTVGGGQRGPGLALERDAQCVTGLGPVERDGANPVNGVDQHELCHARP